MAEDGQGKAVGRTRWRKRKLMEMTERSDSEEEVEPQLELDRLLNQSLETKSIHHKLTTVNVKNILHEVITNEHVVAMMKAAINETEAVPPFEPKMTRSKLKEVVERGVVIPAWNMSPINKVPEVKFVDIPLAEEDSSDEEYRPDEEEEDETAEDTFQETPPTCPVTDSSFLEKLHAVEEELICMEPYQAELRAPDITPDMYDSGPAPEDREWTHWLRGLMSSDVENEGWWSPVIDQSQSCRTHLRVQVEQHVQLLLQVHLLTSCVPQLQSEAVLTKQFLVELDVLAQRGEAMGAAGVSFQREVSFFRASNLGEALQLLEDQWTPPVYQPRTRPRDNLGRVHRYPVLPAQLAWLFATRGVFLYPELLPCSSLDPALYRLRRTNSFTTAEDWY
ncbi:hypothetical protein NHX12_023096 [Muraenolepis orangiensis]|uniref:Uncharacterized protein n=1 Tax=Muraenolepis orangiensis TaxID=630683 RepID=A0A9Q0EJD9_9TELE|nr:hypothetical protein NHX12_023096 [Muraenolepis orangiensis]